MKKSIPKAVMFFTLFFVFPNLLYAQNSNGKEFAGLDFGVGISLTIDFGKHDRIRVANLDENGIVRITKQNNDIPRIMLESHYFFTPAFLNEGKGMPTIGIGPFIALQPGTDEIIEAIALGYMAGFKRKKEENSSSSWNIGIGLVVDPNVQILGEGIIKNMPLPAGETQIRYKETSQWGTLLIVSFTF